MTSRVLYKPRVQQHLCDLPLSLTQGAVWRCGECGRYWRWRDGERRLYLLPRLRVLLWHWRDAVRFRWEPR